MKGLREVVSTERRSLIAALAFLAAKRETFEEASKRAESDRNYWAMKEVLSGRIRARCVKELEETVVGEDKFHQPKYMSATAAQSAASDHPTYTAFKDEVAQLQAAKDWSADQVTVELQRLECAKLDVEAKIELLRTARIEPEAFALINDSPSGLEEQLRASVEQSAS